MKAQLEILLAQIDEQMKVVERNLRIQAEVTHLRRWRNMTPQEIIDSRDLEPEEPTSIFEFQLGDGSYPMVPLLAAKAQILSALAMIRITEVE